MPSRTKPQSTTKTILNIPVEDLHDHEDLKHITKLEDLKEYFAKKHHGDKKREGLAEEMGIASDAMDASIEEHGVLEPIKVIPRDAGGYWTVEGRHRVSRAKKFKLATVPAEVVSEAEAESIITESVLGRRHLSRGARAYFTAIRHPECLGLKSGRPRKSFNNPVENTVLTTLSLAKRAGCSEELMKVAISLAKKCAASKTVCASIEPSIWAGVDLNRLNAGAGGAAETAGKSRATGNHESAAKLFDRLNWQFSTYAKWPVEQKESFESKASVFAKELDRAAAAVLRDALILALAVDVTPNPPNPHP